MPSPRTTAKPKPKAPTRAPIVIIADSLSAHAPGSAGRKASTVTSPKKKKKRRGAIWNAGQEKTRGRGGRLRDPGGREIRVIVSPKSNHPMMPPAPVARNILAPD